MLWTATCPGRIRGWRGEGNGVVHWGTRRWAERGPTGGREMFVARSESGEREQTARRPGQATSSSSSTPAGEISTPGRSSLNPLLGGARP